MRAAERSAALLFCGNGNAAANRGRRRFPQCIVPDEFLDRDGFSGWNTAKRIRRQRRQRLLRISLEEPQ
jgi:hypothetical protein